MKKAFDSTIEEAVEVRLRYAEIVGSLWKMKWAGLLVSPAVFAVMFLLLTYLPGRFFDDPAKLIVSGIAGAGFIPYWLLTYRNDYRKRIRKMLVKVLGTDQPVPLEYELAEAGLACRKCGQEIRFSWHNVQSLNDRDDSIELIMALAGIVIIPKRIFDGPGELQEWTRFIESHVGPHCRSVTQRPIP